MKFKEGFVSLPFMVLFSACLSFSSFLSYKITKEIEILYDLKEMNFQVQHERKILEIIHCLIQCDVPDSLCIEVDQIQVLLHFEDDLCYVSDSICTLTVEVDHDVKKLKNVVIEK